MVVVASRNSGSAIIEVNRLALLVSLEMLLKVLSLVLILTVLGTQKDMVLAGCLVVDLLNCEFICCDQVGNHSLQTFDGMVSLTYSRVSAVVWLAIS
jgi:hypothetical protein